MALPRGERVSRFLRVTELLDEPQRSEFPYPGLIEVTGREQRFVFRGKAHFHGHVEEGWFGYMGSIDPGVDTILVGEDGWVMRAAGEIDTVRGQEMVFNAKSALSFETNPKDAPKVDLPVTMSKLDCLILEDGRVFFPNDSDGHIKMALSLEIPVEYA